MDGGELREWARGKLARISAEGRIRRCQPYSVVENDPARLILDGKTFINFGSNDYLGLSQAPSVREAATRSLAESGVGAGASRVLSGSRIEHQELEASLSSWLQKERTLLFGAGYLANLGVLSTIVGRHDTVLADRLIHASLLDGIALAGAKLIRYAHNDIDDLRRHSKRASAQRLFIVTESVFSMDGDIAPLAEIVDVAGEVGASVIVDEAHALGVFGDDGSGVLTPELRDHIAIITGTLSKACGSYGGFAAGSEELVDLLVSSARSFLFNTGLPAASAAAASSAIAILRRSDADRRTLLSNAEMLRLRLRSEGFTVGESISQIIPVLLGSGDAVMKASEALKRSGLLVPAIRPPTVAAGTERLRISLTSCHTDEQLELLVRTLCAYRDGAS